MIRHSNSLFISVIFHLFLATLLFLSYQYIFKSSPKKEQEHLLCIQLSDYECVAPKKKSITPPKHPQTHKKITKKTIVKKTIKKPKIQKKVEIKKIKIKKILPISKEVIKSSPVPHTQVSEKHNETKELKKRVEQPILNSTPCKTNEEIYIDTNIQKIVELLQNNLYYPRRARRRGIQGDVKVRFHLSTDATISQVTVLSSDNTILSRGAIQTIENLSTQFPHPKEELTLTLPISYHFKH